MLTTDNHVRSKAVIFLFFILVCFFPLFCKATGLSIFFQKKVFFSWAKFLDLQCSCEAVCWHSYQLITSSCSKRSKHLFHAKPNRARRHTRLCRIRRALCVRITNRRLTCPPVYTKHSHTWTLLTQSSLAADGTHTHTHTRGPKVTHIQTGMQSSLVIGQSAGNCHHC